MESRIAHKAEPAPHNSAPFYLYMRKRIEQWRNGEEKETESVCDICVKNVWMTEKIYKQN